MNEDIGYGYEYNKNTNTLIAKPIISGYGLFSTVTLLASAASIANAKYNTMPDKIDVSNTLSKFKDSENSDVFKKVFEINKDISTKPNAFGPNVHHTIYNKSLLSLVGPYFKYYASPTPTVKDAICELKEKYDLYDTNRISVIYRGSDKWTDMGNFIDAGPGAYVHKTRKLFPDCKNVLIQSEEKDVCKYFKQTFKAKFISETDIGNTGLLQQPIPEIDKEKWLIYFIAALWIHAESKYLVTYTGNSGFFVSAIRESQENLYQEQLFNLGIDEVFYNE